jgi:hypothetical protein
MPEGTGYEVLVDGKPSRICGQCLQKLESPLEVKQELREVPVKVSPELKNYGLDCCANTAWPFSSDCTITVSVADGDVEEWEKRLKAVRSRLLG